jgi:hypothetical protein
VSAGGKIAGGKIAGGKIAGGKIAGGKIDINIRVHSARQWCDGRDPAPFRERDLDEQAVQYVIESVEDVSTRCELRLVVWITDEGPSLGDVTIRAAVHAHFEYLLGRLDRQLHKHVRQGQIKFLVGFLVLAGFLTLSRLLDVLSDSTARRVVQEGLSIVAWVAMWRPLEVLLYDWWPLLSERRLLRRIRDAEVAVVHQKSGSVVPGLPTKPILNAT